MNPISQILITLLTLTGSLIQADDFAAQKSAAQKLLSSSLPDPTDLITAGEMDELSKQIQAIFPSDKRTAAEALVLGDALFGFDPQASYRLHKEAFDKYPNNELVQLEWAMEQHRRGEFAGAIDGYQYYLRQDPQFATIFGLLAECLMRTGKIEEAVKAWEDSEAAPHGTIEKFENYVYQLHTPVPAEIVRAEIIKRVKKADLVAAEELIAYDTKFPRDWWNIERAVPFLKADIAIIQSANFPPSERLNQLIEIAKAMSESEQSVDPKSLEKLGLIIDKQNPLPISNLLIPCILDGIKPENFDRLRPMILERAREANDSKLFLTVAVYDMPNALAITKEAFKVACSEEIAQIYCVCLFGKNELTLDHPDFVKARSMYPENRFLETMHVNLALNNKEAIQPALVKAILAEYKRFSPQKGLLPRPGARLLRAYFKLLREELNRQK